MNEPPLVDYADIDLFTSSALPPAIIEFWAPWCAPCLALAPVMRQLAHELQGIARVGRVDIEASPELALRFGVENAPTLVVFVQGQAVAHVVGFQPAATLKYWIRGVLKSSTFG